LKNFIVINYVDLISQALLDFLNSEQVPINAKGKLVVTLTQNNQKILSYYLKSHFKNNIFFGKESIVIKPCDVQNNWRYNCELSEKHYKYEITDNSVWINPDKMIKFFDFEFERLKKEFKNSKFIYKEDMDSIDLFFCFKKLLGIEIINDNLYRIVEDGNKIFMRNNYWPSFILSDVELLLKENNLLL